MAVEPMRRCSFTPDSNRTVGTPRSTAHRSSRVMRAVPTALPLVVACDGRAGDFDALGVEHAETVEGVQPSNDPSSVVCHQDDVC
jgi:hypothetical protein